MNGEAGGKRSGASEKRSRGSGNAGAERAENKTTGAAEEAATREQQAGDTETRGDRERGNRPMDTEREREDAGPAERTGGSDFVPVFEGNELLGWRRQNEPRETATQDVGEPEYGSIFDLEEALTKELGESLEGGAAARGSDGSDTADRAAKEAETKTAEVLWKALRDTVDEAAKTGNGSPAGTGERNLTRVQRIADERRRWYDL